MKIYTKTGDKGDTSLFGGDRVPKNNQRIVSYGCIDELNACLGIVVSFLKEQKLKQELISIQKKLFVLGSELATPNNKLLLANGKPRLTELIEPNDVLLLEASIDKMENQLEPLTNFILPGGIIEADSFCQLARTICRRSEREVIALNFEEKVREILIQFLNRLSDYLFVLGRYILHLNQEKPIEWKTGF